jgi:hypothetical protein
MRLEGLDQLKNPMTSSEIEPATLRHVVFYKDSTVSEEFAG